MFKLPSRVLLGFLFCVPTAFAQSNVVCTADVPSITCKTYSSYLNWTLFPWLKNIEVVIADPKSFKDEEKKISDIITNLTKAAKTVPDLNKATGRKVGTGVFANVFMETDGVMIKKIVVSTDRREIVKSTDGKDLVISDEDNPKELSDGLMYYVLGFQQGVLHEAGRWTQ